MSINIPDQFPYTLSTESAAALAQLQSDINSFHEACEQHAQKVAGIDPSSGWDQAKEKTAADLRSERLDLWNQELALRSRVDAFFSSVQEVEKPLAASRAFEQLESTKSGLRASLVGLGYTDGPMPELDGRHGIPPMFIFYHPRVVAERNTLDAISRHDTLPNRSANQAAMQKVRAKIGFAAANATVGLH